MPLSLIALILAQAASLPAPAPLSREACVAATLARFPDERLNPEGVARVKIDALDLAKRRFACLVEVEAPGGKAFILSALEPEGVGWRVIAARLEHAAVIDKDDIEIRAEARFAIKPISPSERAVALDVAHHRGHPRWSEHEYERHLLRLEGDKLTPILSLEGREVKGEGAEREVSDYTIIEGALTRGFFEVEVTHAYRSAGERSVQRERFCWSKGRYSLKEAP